MSYIFLEIYAKKYLFEIPTACVWLYVYVFLKITKQHEYQELFIEKTIFHSHNQSLRLDTACHKLSCDHKYRIYDVTAADCMVGYNLMKASTLNLSMKMKVI